MFTKAQNAWAKECLKMWLNNCYKWKHGISKIISKLQKKNSKLLSECKGYLTNIIVSLKFSLLFIILGTNDNITLDIVLYFKFEVSVSFKSVKIDNSRKKKAEGQIYETLQIRLGDILCFDFLHASLRKSIFLEHLTNL